MILKFVAQVFRHLILKSDFSGYFVKADLYRLKTSY